ncbi:MAG: ATP-binding protein [Spirochaetota bacterium]
MKQGRTLRKTIYPRSAALLLLLLLLFTVLTLQLSKNYVFKQSQENLFEVAALIENAIAQQPDLSPAGLQTHLDQLAENSRIRITIIRSDGTVIVDTERDPQELDDHSQRPEIRKAFAGKPNSVVRYSESIHRDLLYYAKPLQLDTDTSHVLRVALPYTEITASYKPIYLYVAAGGVLIITFSLMLFFLLRRLVEKPLGQLASTAQHYAQLQFDTDRNPEVPLSEMQSIFDSMHQMAGKINEQFAALHQQKDALQSVLDGMKEAVFVLDGKGIITQANPAAARLFASGGNPGELTNRFYLQVLKNDLLKDLVEKTLYASSQEIAGPAITDQQIQIDSMYFQVYISRLTGVRDQNLLLVLNDITALMHLERVRRDFVANVSHELKTPVTSIKGFTETLLYHDTTTDSQTINRFLSIILNQSQRLEAIIDDLLTLSKLEQTAHRKQHFQRIDLGKVIDDSLQICNEKHREVKREITVVCSKELSVFGNLQLVEQAFINLIDNAMKYSEPGSPIRIVCTERAHEVQIDITDTGFGIPQKDLHRIFERFYRIDKGRSREKGGTGLGLSIVKHIASQHDGAVWVHSTEGEGSTFSLAFPKP